MTDSFETILVETKGRVGVITLNRPQALNALNGQLLAEVLTASQAFDRDEGIGAIVVTGSEKAFAAGADIKEMKDKSFRDVSVGELFGGWDDFAAIRTPVIAAVSGYALGGGAEVAMMCDIIIASETAKFGQPEINIGVIPGMGGSQRLTRAIGKAKAMDMILTGRMMDAAEALASGLVSRVVPIAELMDVAMDVATTIASKSLPVAYAAKEAVSLAFETTLAEGVRAERRGIYSLFALDDQKEGMAAFAEKRDPNFTHR
ncbi:MAG TPA: enoyl-CoA hydratase [Terrimesophilobacter sp.]|nr:enoyl-CoA hydratase [Terrimesophilobacter sp.]HRP99778.1 enoyl-CoA hydratase [Terrimesophilobacter sp.]